MSMRTNQNPGSGGFTLIELLVVILIVAVLAGLLLPAIGAARNYTKKTTAKTEVSNIELAMKQYLTEYRVWPNRNALGGIQNPESTAIAIKGAVAQLLQGDNSTGSNSKGLKFMQFNKMAADGITPVNPWCTPAELAYPPDNRLYWMKLDANYDNVINQGPPVPSTSVSRPVIVWTFDDKGNLIASWQ